MDRFVLKKSDLEAAEYMKYVIYDAYDKLTTKLYDEIQYAQNGYDRWELIFYQKKISIYLIILFKFMLN